jgi:hypothetical protein
MNVQFAHDAFAMRLRGSHAVAVVLGNFLGALAFGDEREDFAFAFAQFGDGLGVIRVRDILVQRDLRDQAAELSLACVNSFNRLHEFICRRVFQNISARSRLDDA